MKRGYGDDPHIVELVLIRMARDGRTHTDRGSNAKRYMTMYDYRAEGRKLEAAE